ncbi:MAG: PKD-like family lipoprotein [Chitinophagaceae bacterium]
MKKNSFLTSIIALLLVVQGCYKDKGNYNYKELDEVQIDTSGAGILASYAVYRYDTLQIEPKVFLNGAPVSNEAQVSDKLSFTWSIFQATVGGTIQSRDTLSQTIRLKAPITKPAGKWIVHLAVKDLITQVETYQRFNLDVSEVLSDGWMVLYEKEGNTDVGLIVDDRTKLGVVTPRLFLDLIKSGNETPLAGKPVAMLHSAAPLSSAQVLVASEKDMVGVERSSFQATFKFNDLFWSAPAERNVGYVGGTLVRREMAIVNNRVHAVNFASSGLYRTNKFGVELNGTYGELEKWSTLCYGAAYDAVVYDKTNKKFKYVPANGTAVMDFPTQLPTTGFNVGDVGLDMKASDWGLTNYEYSMMSDNAGTYLMVSNFMGVNTNVGLRKIDMSTSPGVNNVATLSAAATGQFVLYGSGSNVYIFKYNTTLPAEMAWSAPAGEQVTCVRLQKFYFPSIQASLLPLPHQVVYIATWNETHKLGKVYSFRIDPSSGAINTSSERVTQGYGKVKDMSYKWNL